LDVPNNVIIHRNGNTYDDFAHWYCDETNISKYPTTYEECKALLQLQDFMIQARCGYEWRLISNFQQLLMCRDAYWKIAGEELGLDNYWEPDWTDGKIKYGITYYRNFLIFTNPTYSNKILVFPTEEMRDVFYDNFKNEIESCKILL